MRRTVKIDIRELRLYGHTEMRRAQLEASRDMINARIVKRDGQVLLRDDCSDSWLLTVEGDPEPNLAPEHRDEWLCF